MTQGWPKEPARHSLAARGVSTLPSRHSYGRPTAPIVKKRPPVFERQMMDLLDLDETRLQRFANRLSTARLHAELPVESITFVYELRYGNEREATIFTTGTESDEPYYVSKNIIPALKSVLGDDGSRLIRFQQDVEKLLIERSGWRDQGRCREVIISDGKKSIRVSVAG